MKIYYAHSLHLYDTAQEQRDIRMLSQLGFEVLNPNCKEIQERVDVAKRSLATGDKDYMRKVFNPIVTSCDCLAFRAHIDGSISAGVAKEIEMAVESGMEIIELPNLMSTRMLSVQDTRLALQYLGQR